MKKLISIMLLATMTVSMFAGCGDKESKSEGTASKDGAKGADKAAEEISVMVWDRAQEFKSGMTLTDNTVTKWVQEQVLADKNVKVKYSSVPRGTSDDVVNAMMAGGTTPDAILTYNRDMFTDFADKGGLADLTAAVDENGAAIKEVLGEEVYDAGIVNEKLYAVTARRGTQVGRHLGYIRKDWLDKVSLAVPTTTAELEKALYAFKEQDPGAAGDKLVPWAMGGNPTAERYFQSFVTSFIDKPFDGENVWTYQEAQAVFHPEAKAGFEKLNQFYNDGVISEDFAVDTNDDKYKQDIANGFAGFILDDATRQMDQFKISQQSNAEVNWVPVNCFTGSNTEYQGNAAETQMGAYVMVPKKSEDKANAVVKYLDWLADVENATKVSYGPEYVTSENGVPVPPTQEEALEKGYPYTLDDFNIVNKHFDFVEDKDKVAGSALSWMYVPNGTEPIEYTKSVYAAWQKDMKVYPVFPQVMPESAKYGKSVQDLLVQFGYRTISASKDKFESTYKAEIEQVNQAGFDKILAEKKAYYEENVK